MTLAQLALEIDPTPAMLKGDQTVWQCRWCGTVVVLPRKGKPGVCPAEHDEDHGWSRQRLPVAGLRKVGTGVTVLCAFCPRTCTGDSPDHTHLLMEGHYREAHAEVIDVIVGEWL